MDVYPRKYATERVMLKIVLVFFCIGTKSLILNRRCSRKLSTENQDVYISIRIYEMVEI